MRTRSPGRHPMTAAGPGRIWRLGVCGLVGMMLGQASFASGDIGLLPPEGYANGWARVSASKVFGGPALYDHIDGGGEAFLELGFEACTVQKYYKGKEVLTFEVYRMADAPAALGIYLANCGKETPSPGFPERHTVGQTQLLMTKGRYYVVATVYPGGKSSASLLAEFATYAAKRIEPAPPPAVLALLPKEGLLPGSVRIIRGAISLQAAGDFGDGDSLMLAGRVTAVAGDYAQGASPPRTEIIAEYPSAEAARAGFGKFALTVGVRSKILAKSEGGFTYQEPGGTFGRAALDGSKLSVERGLTAKPGL
jgi:hypothetical protein